MPWFSSEPLETWHTKKIFPALQALVKRGHLDDVPVIGVAKSPWTVDQLRMRAQESLEKQGRGRPGGFPYNLS